MKILIWCGIIFCVSQSAMFSGLNLAFFSLSKLHLEIESNKNNPQALKVAKPSALGIHADTTMHRSGGQPCPSKYFVYTHIGKQGCLPVQLFSQEIL